MSEAKSGNGSSVHDVEPAIRCAPCGLRTASHLLAFECPRHRIRAFGDDRQQHLSRLVGAMGALFPIAHRTEREMKAAHKRRHIQLLERALAHVDAELEKLEQAGSI